MSDITNDTITATQIPVGARLDFLPRHFGRRDMLVVENTVYNQLRALCAQYQGGYWEFYDLSNGGCYLAPRGTEYRLFCEGNGFEATVSADAAGIIATLHALSHLSFKFQDSTLISDHFHQLRAFALRHAEQSAIFSAID